MNADQSIHEVAPFTKNKSETLAVDARIFGWMGAKNFMGLSRVVIMSEIQFP